jgi:hypothetical protein
MENPYGTPRDENTPVKVFELPPEGKHKARLIWAIDTGTHKDAYEGVETLRHKIYLGWELVETKMEDSRPFMVGAYYTISNGTYGPYIAKTSNTSKVLRKWQDWDEQQASKMINLMQLACDQAPAYITVSVEPTKKDPAKLKYLIDSIKPCKDPVPPAANDSLVYLLNKHSDKALALVPDWLKGKEGDHPERRTIAHCLENNGGVPARQKDETSKTTTDRDDDIPF